MATVGADVCGRVGVLYDDIKASRVRLCKSQAVAGIGAPKQTENPHMIQYEVPAQTMAPFSEYIVCVFFLPPHTCSCFAMLFVKYA